MFTIVNKPKPATRKRTRPTEKRDYWVFNQQGQHYGPFPLGQAESLAKELPGQLIQADSLEEAGKQWRQAGIRKARGRSE